MCYLVRNAHGIIVEGVEQINILTSLKKSPTHFAIITTIIIGMPNLMLPVASIKITVRLIVIRTTPPATEEHCMSCLMIDSERRSFIFIDFPALIFCLFFLLIQDHCENNFCDGCILFNDNDDSSDDDVRCNLIITMIMIMTPTYLLMERFSIDCCKTKSKAILLF